MIAETAILVGRSCWVDLGGARLSVGWSIVFGVSIEGVLRRQAGTISRRQALAAGMSRSAVAVRVAEGRWRPVHPGVCLASTHDWTAETWVWAAMLWAGQPATLSGLTAAWWHGLLAEWPGVVEVTVPRRQRLGVRPNLLVRRRDLHPTDRQQRRGLMVTGQALTALEAAVALGHQGGPLLDRALQRTVRFDAVLEAHNRNLGRNGSASAGTLLVAAADRASSAAERLMIKVLRDAGLTGWECGVRLGLAQRRRTVPRRPAASEQRGAGRLAGVALHLTRPHPTSRRGHFRDPRRSRQPAGGLSAPP
jgi:hypothetical protein